MHSNGRRARETVRQFEEGLKKLAPTRFVLRLYVAGSSPRSLRAVRNIKQICEENLPEGYQLDIVDLYQDPTVAGTDQIVAVPTLVKYLPGPLRKLIGDLSNHNTVLHALGVKQHKQA